MREPTERSEQLLLAGFGGISRAAKHDPRGDLGSVALFGKPGLHEEAFVSTWSQPIDVELIDDVEARFGAQVLPTASV